MIQLYLIFFAVSSLLFGLIAYFSYRQHDKERVSDKVASSKASSKKIALPPSLDNTPAKNQPADIVPSFAETDKKQKQEPSLNPQVGKQEGAPKVKQKDRQKSEQQATLENTPKQAAKKPAYADSTATQSSIDNNAQASSQDKTVISNDKLHRDKASVVVVDLVAKVKNERPVEQTELLRLFRAHDYKFHRKIHVYGLNELTERWCDIEFELPSSRFTELGISIQLADRDGAVTQKELHDFQQMVLDFSNTVDAPFEFSFKDLDQAQQQAALLDEIGRRYDAMAVLNIIPKNKQGFRYADIASCAQDLQMSGEKEGVFVKVEGQKNNLSALYRLACTDMEGRFGFTKGAAPQAVHDLVVYMNVPATRDPEKVFQIMVKDAKQLATWLEGKVVNGKGKALTQQSYSVLMQQITSIVFSMSQEGIVPGDSLTKKLF